MLLYVFLEQAIDDQAKELLESKDSFGQNSMFGTSTTVAYAFDRGDACFDPRWGPVRASLG
jgi:hypothetical protein